MTQMPITRAVELVPGGRVIVPLFAIISAANPVCAAAAEQPTDLVSLRVVVTAIVVPWATGYTARRAGASA
jgi:hypothetical protein